MVLDAIEAVGHRCDGRVLALNSYENRVYQIWLEDARGLTSGPGDAPPVVVAKFYRPGRWSDAQILEEHDFVRELAERELPVVAPLGQRRRFAACPSRLSLRRVSTPRRALAGVGNQRGAAMGGRFLGEDSCGQAEPHASMSGRDCRWKIWGEGRGISFSRATGCPTTWPTKYADVTDELLQEVEARAEGWRGATLGRILGDCHRGNILWTDQGPHFVDLDDCLTGPAIQDLWMLLAGGQEEMRTGLRDLLEGYEQFLPFDRGEIALIEPLRALRMIHYSAWLARRWHDPAFPQAFPWFAEPRYWEQHYRALEEQLTAVMNPPLEL
jgi:Ser/Thr protein kinase RdoA (MazF antagonist)